MVVSDLIFLVAYVALLLGILTKTALPFLRKKAQSNNLKFERRFFFTALVSIIASFLYISVLVLPEIETVTLQFWITAVFVPNWSIGLSINWALNEVMKAGETPPPSP